MLRFATLIALCGILAIAAAPVRADVLAQIDISDQRMELFVDGAKKATWKVSTGLKRNWTPTGSWNPYFLSKNHRSSLFRGAPMPYSVFFKGDYAVHGTNAIKRLGRPASHGCIRLHPKNAKVLFNLVRKYGKANTVIKIVH